jgi:hypothetical protein
VVFPWRQGREGGEVLDALVGVGLLQGMQHVHDTPVQKLDTRYWRLHRLLFKGSTADDC